MGEWFAGIAGRSDTYDVSIDVVYLIILFLIDISFL